MAIVLKHRPNWVGSSWREPRGNWSFEDETQRCIVMDLGDLFVSQRKPNTLAIQANVLIKIREILSGLIPVGQLWVGSEIVIRFDEFESTMIKGKYFRDDIYLRAVLMDVMFAWALENVNGPRNTLAPLGIAV